MESDRDKTLQVMARASCNTGEVACEACHLTAERILTALEASGRAVVPVVMLEYSEQEMATWARVLPHPQAGSSDLRYLHSLAIMRQIAASPYGKAVVQEASAERSVANSKPVVKEDSE